MVRLALEIKSVNGDARILVVDHYAALVKQLRRFVEMISAQLQCQGTLFDVQTCDSVYGAEVTHVILLYQVQTSNIQGLLGIQRDRLRFYMCAMRATMCTYVVLPGEALDYHFQEFGHASATGVPQQTHEWWCHVYANLKNLEHWDLSTDIVDDVDAAGRDIYHTDSLWAEIIEQDRKEPDAPKFRETLGSLHDSVDLRAERKNASGVAAAKDKQDLQHEMGRDLLGKIGKWNDLAAGMMSAKMKPRLMGERSVPAKLASCADLLIDYCHSQIEGHSLWSFGFPFSAWPYRLKNLETCLADGSLHRELVHSAWSLAHAAFPEEKTIALFKEARVLHKAAVFIHEGVFYFWKACGSDRIAHILTDDNNTKLKVYLGGSPRATHSYELVAICRDIHLAGALLYLPELLTQGRVKRSIELCTVETFGDREDIQQEALAQLLASYQAVRTHCERNSLTLSSLFTDDSRNKFAGEAFWQKPPRIFARRQFPPTEITPGLFLGDADYSTFLPWCLHYKIRLIVCCLGQTSIELAEIVEKRNACLQRGIEYRSFCPSFRNDLMQRAQTWDKITTVFMDSFRKILVSKKSLFIWIDQLNSLLDNYIN